MGGDSFFKTVLATVIGGLIVAYLFRMWEEKLAQKQAGAEAPQ